MEMTYNVLSRREVGTNIKQIKKVIKEFRNLNMNKKVKKMKPMEFINMITSSTYDYVVQRLVNLLFTNNDKDLGNAILFSYCISQYPNDIFNHKMTSDDKKLVCASNIIIYYLDKLEIVEIKGAFPDDNFMDALDAYYTLYKKWISRDMLRKIDELNNMLMNEIQICKLQRQRNANIKYIIDEMFNINKNYATKILLNNYELYENITDIIIIIWNNIRMHTNNMNIYLIIITEIRIRLIKILKDPQDRKDIYYKIDSDYILKMVRENRLTRDILIGMINIIATKIKILEPSYNFNEDEGNFIENFKLIYEIMYKK